MSKNILGYVAAAALFSLTGISAAQAQTPLAGAYGGVQGGYDIFKDQWGAGKWKGIEGGVFMGYNAQVAEQMIVGVEANLNVTDAKNSTIDIKTKNDYGISARAGFLATENVLVYARGGYQRALIGTTGLSHHFDGWTLGAGIETAVADNISVRAEYIYAGYKANAAFGANPSQQNMNVGVAFHF